MDYQNFSNYDLREIELRARQLRAEFILDSINSLKNRAKSLFQRTQTPSAKTA